MEIDKLSISNLEVYDIDKFVIVNATVIRVANKKALEKSKLFRCSACQNAIIIYADVYNMNKIQLPPKCMNYLEKKIKPSFFTNFFPKKGSKNTNSNPTQTKTKTEPCGNFKFEPDDKTIQWVDYQEIKIQESFRTIKPGNIPKTLWVVLEVTPIQVDF